MSEIKAWGYIHPEIDKILKDKAVSNTCITKKRARYNTFPLYTKQQLDSSIKERDILIRDLRKELNERRYGRSTSKWQS